MTNRLKFLLAGPVFEAVYSWLPVAPHREVVVRLGALGHARVLELCAGTGYLARQVAQANPAARVDGVDLSAHMLADGRKRLGPLAGRVRLLDGDVTALPFDDGTFDVVVVSFGLHELPTELRRRAVSEAARVLRAGGRFATVEVDRPSGAGGRVFDAYLWALEPRDAPQVCGDGLVDELTAHGFDVTEHRRAGSSSPTQVVVAERTASPVTAP